MSIGKQSFWVAGALCFLLLASALATRPLLPIDETRYLSVAWEMWQRSDFLVPHLNGSAYSDKPPLLFWLINAGWWLFGVNEIWARMVSPLFGLANLLLTAAIARELWPDRASIASLAPLVVLGTALWSIFTTLVMFDMLLTSFVLLGILGVLSARRRGGTTGWVLLSTSIGLGALAKGPVILLHVLPVALLGPLWSGERPAIGWTRWYGATALSLLLGAAIALTWAIPAAAEGGSRYAHAILLGQTADRVTSSFAHARPVWWYVQLLPALLYPWVLWPPVWRALAGVSPKGADLGTRFCLAWLVPAFVGFSLISGKQIHYLLPLVPACALLFARALQSPRASVRPRDSLLAALVLLAIGVALGAAPYMQLPESVHAWTSRIAPSVGLTLCLAGAALAAMPVATARRGVFALACAAPFLVVAMHLGLAQHVAPAYDVGPAAHHLRALEQRGSAIAHVGKYHGQYHFVGRLQRPFEVIEQSDVASWRAMHPGGAVVSYRKTDRALNGTEALSFSQPYLSRRVVIEGQ